MKKLIPCILLALTMYGCISMMVDAWDKEMAMQEQQNREYSRGLRK